MMKKLLILIVAIAIYLHFFPQPEISMFYEQQKSNFLKKLSQSTKVSFKEDLTDIYHEISTEYIGFSETELNTLKELTSTVEGVATFYKYNCQNKSGADNRFHPDNVDKICQKMSKVIAKL